MKVFEGIVIAAHTPKTVKVRVEGFSIHPLYKKRMRKTSQFLCHDEIGVVVGDKVTIKEVRPMSALKRFSVMKVTGKGRVIEKTIEKVEKAVKKVEKVPKTEAVEKVPAAAEVVVKKSTVKPVAKKEKAVKVKKEKKA